MSLIGAGMRSHPGVSATFFGALADGRRQHRDDLHLGDPDLGRGRRRRTSTSRSPPRTGPSTSTPARSRRSSTGGRAGEHRPAAAKPTLAVVGATGAVGTVMLDLLSTRDDVWGEIRLVASPAVGRAQLRVRGADIEVVALSRRRCSTGVDVAMFDVPDEVSARWAPVAAARGVVVVDNSGAFRMDPEVPAGGARGQPGRTRTGRRASSPTPTARRCR